MTTESIDERAAVAAGLERLKIFPLPSSVLIPEGHLPFHLFEPRYQEMIADCLESDRVLAIALLTTGWETDRSARPPVHEVLGIGYVQNDQSLPDGRTNILLHGVARARILEEHPPDRAYREVRAELIPEQRDNGPEHSAEGLRLRQLVLGLASRIAHGSVKKLARACAAESNPGRLADLVASAVLVEPAARQNFLEETDLDLRLEITTRRVAEILLENSEPPGHGVLA